jgi:ketol-acid reductoisomerase
MAKIKFGSVEETVITRDEYPLEKAREILKDEVVDV